MINWILDTTVFEDQHQRLIDAAKRAGHNVYKTEGEIDWGRSNLSMKGQTVFHGSLGDANTVRENLPWTSYCHPENFLCSNWYPNAKRWLIHDRWVMSRVDEITHNPRACLMILGIGEDESLFIRPNSPLKPFSGRVLKVSRITKEALDFGFYYDDPRLEIVVAPVVEIGEEWRLIVSDDKVICGSCYDPDGRNEKSQDVPEAVMTFGQMVADHIHSPDRIYVLDVCEKGDDLKLLELNPFSGADLYGCDRDIIVKEVERVLCGKLIGQP